MAKLLLHGSLYVLAVILFCMEGALTSSTAAENAPLLTNGEEYAIFAAVLFPMEQTTSIDPNTKIDPQQKAYSNAQAMKLEGITGNNYRLSCFTIGRTNKENKGSDQGMIADYNRRNEQVFCLDEKRLLPLIPKKGMVILVDPREKKTLEKGMISFSETTYISRPGFNQDMTRAILQINHVADPEMGVGYQVYLEKSALTGTWKIINFDLNRRY